jgi:hypothetical protein
MSEKATSTASKLGRGMPSASLYKSEREIAALVLGPDAGRWPSLAAIWEREGLPTIDTMAGMRFWPAVRAFFDRRHGLMQGHVPARADGDETW